ncbi:GPI inositol-deacylase [Brienomyrus brachyistius]|uniref:GPI inositol-deacylase n=1 Tax=Brienomyrus brachyistius TaxID=42636 RepID=UPI0020B201E3|nr:GPI inositol-deacylase [Brienomyrus brachyistius]
MKSVTVAFYSCVLGLLGMGLRELMWGFEENRCSMTYMFEYPEYRRVQLPRRVANQYPGYGLYLYGEGAYAQETRGLKLSGAPVLFLPGNAGSYKQARSLGSVALRKAEHMAGRIHLNVFTVDFREELVALYGGSLQRQTLFLHESIKAILRLYKNQPHPPRSVVLVGHSMGGVVARALFTLPRFDPTLVSLILTQASPHQAPVLALDADLLDFYSTVRRHWCAGTEELHNVTVLSVGGGHRDYQVRSGLTALPCPQGDPSKLSMVTTAVPRTWVSTDHLSIVWCKELVLATVRALFDLIDPDTRQFTEDQQRRMAVLKHHFIRHPMRLLEEQHDTEVSWLSGPAEAWTEVNTLRLLYSAPKEPRVKYFLFALSGRRKAYSHFHCRSSSLEMSSWLYGCTQMNTSFCAQAIDLSWGTELLPAYKVVTVKLSDLSSVSHLVIGASNLAGNQFSVECEWLNLDSRMVSTPVPHVLSLGLTVSDVTLNSTGLLHTVRLENFHQVYQAFRITVMSQCKTGKDRLPSVYRLSVPWFREGFFTAASVPSVTEIAAMLHTSRPDNTSSVLLQLHTAPNCQYKVSVRTSFPKVLGQMLRYCGPTLPSYTAVGLLLACERQIDSLIKTGRPLAMSTAVGGAIQPHKVEIPVYLLQLLLRLSWFRDGWSALSLPLPDSLPVSTLDGVGSVDPAEDWSRLLGLLLQVLGAGVAFWGSALFRLALRALSLVMAPLHRPCLSRHCGVLHPWAQVLLILTLGVLGRITCGALAFSLAFLCYLYRVLRLLMTHRTLKHVLNLAPQQQKVDKRSSPDEDGHVDEDGHAATAKSNGGPLLTDLVLQEVTDDLELHLSLSALLTVPMVLITPSMIHWARSLRYAIRLQPDPCWPLTLPLLTSTILLINCSCVTFRHSKILVLVPLLLPPLCVAMATFTLLHLYRVTPLLCTALILLLLCSHV